MIKSMTGYGKASCELETKKVDIEVRSLNSKQTDITTKIPYFYKEKEIEIRNECTNRLTRGKIEVAIFYDMAQTENLSVINTEVFETYYKQLSQIKDNLGITSDCDIIGTIMKLPDTLKTDRPVLDDKEWKVVLDTLRKALDEVDAFRSQEGKVLEQDILQRITLIENYLNKIQPYENERIESIKKRIHDSLKEFLGNQAIDKDRFEQELIYYLEKLDITEEKVRLAPHCNYFKETVAMEEAIGKKLSFITQEIGREINTLGAKSNHHEMQKLVIQMKDELEKIKEQVLNIL